MNVINLKKFVSILFHSIIPNANNSVGGAATESVFKTLYIRE